MTDTTFVDEEGSIDASWLNPVNKDVYMRSSKAILAADTPLAGEKRFVSSSDGGWFKAVTGAAALTYADNGGAYCGTITIPTGGDGSSAWVRVDGGYNVGLGYLPEWFGALGDAVTDDLAAFNLVTASGAANLRLNPDSNYIISDTFTIDVDNFYFDACGGTVTLNDAGGTKDIIVVGNGTTRRNGVTIKNITLARSQVATAGYGINLKLVGVTNVLNARIYGNSRIYNGIYVDRGSITNIKDCYIDNPVNYGIYLAGTGTGANKSIDTTINRCRIEGGVNCIRSYDYTEGLFVRDNVFYNTSADCVNVDASSDANGLISFKFQQNDFDTGGTNGLYIDKVNNIQITDNWFASNGAIDIDLRANTSGVVISGNQMYPTVVGIQARGVGAVIAGNFISGGTTAGVYVSSTANHTSIKTNTIANGVYAINLTEASADTDISGNLFYSQSSGVLNFSAATSVAVTSNKGDNTVGTAASISVTASPFTYTSGIRPESVSLIGGTVTTVTIGGVTVTAATNQSFILPPNISAVVTYSSAPSMSKIYL